jgi:hypothetical protein
MSGTGLTTEDVAALEALLTAWRSALEAFNVLGVKALWDEAEPWWVAEEIEQPLIGWPAIESYLGSLPRTIAAMRLASAGHRFKAIGPDHALGLWRLEWKASAWRGNPPSTHRIGGEVTSTALFRRTADGWRFVHYAETVLGPLPFVGKAYKRD